MRKFSFKGVSLLLAALLISLISYGPVCEFISVDTRELARFGVGAKVKAESVETKVYPVESPSRFIFSLKNVNGSIRISGMPTSEISVRAEKTAWGATQEQALKLLKELVLYDKRKDRLDIRVKSPMVTVGSNSPKVDFIISLPESLRQVHVRSTNGNIGVRHVLSSIELRATNGDIEADGSGNMRISTTNGDIDIEAVKGKISASSTNGSISVNAKDSKVSASTTSGDLKFQLESPNGADARTTNGEIDVSLKEVQNVEVTASTNKGNEIYLVGFDKVEKDRGMIRKSATGTLGNGDIKLKFRANNGDVEVRVRE